MKKLRWQLLVVVLALAAIAVLLLSQQTSILPGIIPEVKPTTGGTYTEALIGAIGRLNPVLDYFNPADHDIDRLLYSGLIRFDDRGLPQGDLAETWGISQDGKVYNFSIRPKAVFHDGQPVTSDDILFTLDLLKADESALPADLREFWNQVEAEALDEKTIQFRLPEPFAPFMDYLTFGVLPKHALEGTSAATIAEAAFNLKPIGSGPYKLDKMIVEGGRVVGVSLSAFKDYYRDPAFITQIVFRYYPDGPSALADYRAGKVMGISHLSPDILGEALKEPELNVYTGRLPQLGLIYLNLDNAEVQSFQDPVVRRALMMGLNRQWIIDHILNGQAILADSPVFPETWAYYDGVQRVSFDPQAAIALLKEDGYTIPASGGDVRAKEGDQLSFELLYPEEGLFPAIAEQVQKDWATLGVQATLKGVSYEELVRDHLEPRTYEAALVDLNLARSPDPDPYPFWHQAQVTGGQNYARWDDRQASEYLEQGRVTIDVAERAKRYRNFQVRFATELPALPLYYPVYSYGVDRQVQRVRMGPLFDPSDRFATLTTWFLKTSRATAVPPAAVTDTPQP